MQEPNRETRLGVTRLSRRQTKAARFDKTDGATAVAFCVDTTGETSDIHTVQYFPGDPMVDKIMRETVATWRFEPFMVDGKAIKACTQKVFKLEFK
ncbi:energy transducer TonB [Enhygromyxa salina]|uniref:energy transducer TonB n=1 Tax=Enhygromyxa salina TaxID=215803 RepID=UPI000D0884F9|nr:energy transducer TonB [Enhygromyxa salina]